jgi:hypothetical protein
MDVNVTPEVYVDSKRFPIVAEQNARVARASFEAFRRTMRRDMLWNPFVLRLTRELQRLVHRGARQRGGGFAGHLAVRRPRAAAAAGDRVRQRRVGR